mgnify:CR=1 FL=1
MHEIEDVIETYSRYGVFIDDKMIGATKKVVPVITSTKTKPTLLYGTKPKAFVIKCPVNESALVTSKTKNDKPKKKDYSMPGIRDFVEWVSRGCEWSEDKIKSIIADMFRNLDDCSVDLDDAGTWFFMDEENIYDYTVQKFKDEDPEWIGGYRTELLLEVFTDPIDKEMVRRIKGADGDNYEHNETIGVAIQNREGHCKRMVDLLIKGYGEEALYGEIYNYQDNETHFKFITPDGNVYWAFEQG